MALSTTPTSMKGVVIEQAGDTSVLQYKTDLPVPIPKDGEVLIKNDFIGINFIDINFRSGRYPLPMPHILGVEAEGTIISTSGKTNDLKTGTRVAWIGSSAYAEYSAASTSKVYPLPSGLKPGVAAASLSQGLTALTFIEKSYKVEKGDWILVQGASGGVGLWLCQLLRAVGARVIGTASSDAKLQLARENGAEFVLNYSSDDIVARVLELTNGAGVAAIFDSVGAATFDTGMKSLARDGTMVSIGNTSGAVPPFSITDLLAKNLRVMKPSVLGYLQTREEFVAWAEKLFDFVIKERIDGMVWKTYPLENVKEAHGDMEGRKTSGKLLLKV
ncbi:NAD(P)-binding protein [Acephala macrosclerotiorum]|nr:NAD(P)-binding protein [Acephala macrosclerotiorum]